MGDLAYLNFDQSSWEEFSDHCDGCWSGMPCPENVRRLCASPELDKEAFRGSPESQ